MTTRNGHYIVTEKSRDVLKCRGRLAQAIDDKLRGEEDKLLLASKVAIKFS